jgi:glyoxylase-like metal-dependent hydrolase (beta-lactamase superfamily II)
MLMLRFARWFLLASCLASPLAGSAKGDGVGAQRSGHPAIQSIPAPSGELRSIKVAPNTYYVQGAAEMGSPQNRNFISNAGFVVTADGVVVIDALGSPALAQSLVKTIRRVTMQPIRTVIVTHYHADHIYGLQIFRGLGAKVIAHVAGRPYLTSDIGAQRLASSRETLAPWVNEDTHLVAADQWIDQETTFSLGKTRFVITPVGPAHTAEDVVVRVEPTGILFVGDLVFKSRIPFVGNADSRGWISALETMAKTAPKVIVPGHGAHSDQATKELLFTRDYLNHLRAMMSPAALNLDPFEQAYSAADWSQYESYPLFGAVNRMNAYNVYLSIQQESP